MLHEQSQNSMIRFKFRDSMSALPSLESLKAFAGDRSHACAPVIKSVVLPADYDPTIAFARLRRGEDSFCFIHGETHVFGTEPSAVIRLRSPEQKREGDFLAGTAEGNIVEATQSVLASIKVPEQFRHQTISECNGTVFGFIGFDAIRTFEPHVCKAGMPPKDVLQMPEAVMFVCTSLLVVQGDTMHIMAMCPLEEDCLASNYDIALKRIAELEERITATTDAPTFRDYDGPLSGGVGESNWGSEGYKSHVRFLRERIIVGDMVQTVPSHRLCVETPAHPFNVWCTMRRVSPSLYSYYVECKGGIVIVGASPELLVSVKNGMHCETHPIAGTRKRGIDDAHDELLKADLLADEKERAEHVMLVDLGRNDLNRVCNNVTVPRLMQVDYFSHVMHIVSQVTGTLRPGLTGLDAFRSVFPAGTVSGAPKLQAVEHIYTREGERRGLYAGALGFFDLSGCDTHTCIAIRTLMWLGPKKCYAQAGGGIVLDSNEEDEYQETVAKMNGVMTSVRRCEEDGLHQSGEHAPVLEVSSISAAHNALFRFINCTPSAAAPQAPIASRYEKGCVLLVDNYDSFTWNLYQFLSRRHKVIVVRNDEVTAEECVLLEPSHVVIGPGPCSPAEAGICANVIRAFAGKVPVLGVCMGMEVMTIVYGGEIVVLPEIKHGKTSAVVHDGMGLYSNITQGIHATRYHSLGALAANIAAKCPDLEVSSCTEDGGVVMGLRHRKFVMEGVQFHPESIKTDQGGVIFENFLSWTGGVWPEKDGVSGPPTSILQKIVSLRRKDVDKFVELPVLNLAPAISLRDAVAGASPQLGVVAEVKRASPSKGAIGGENVDAGTLAQRYAGIPGVVGVSVLTEPRFFKGALKDLVDARAVLGPNVAILRKDFVFCEYQLREARAYGADSVLLIVAILTEVELTTLIAQSRDLGMEPLVEAANEYELERAIRSGAKLIGVNARDLHTFQVSVPGACRLIESAKDSGVTMMGLSGVSDRHHMQKYERSGASGCIIGEHLMKCAHVGREMARLLGHCEPPLVKVCGICSVSDATWAAESGADVLGLIFAPASKRVLTIDQAQPIVDSVRKSFPNVKLAGVFANQSAEEVQKIHDALKLDILQYSKGEAVYCPKQVQVWQAVHVEPGAESIVLASSVPDGVVPLFDTASAIGGGTGQSFDWKVLAGVQGPFILAGGLSAGNVALAVRTTGCWAVDVCSRVEKEPRIKDPELVSRFVRAAAHIAVRPLRSIVATLVRGEPVSPDEVAEAVLFTTKGATPAQIGALLVALATRLDIQHDPRVLLAVRHRLMDYAASFSVGSNLDDELVLDIVGTGGDGHDTFNVSTAASLLVSRLGLSNVVVAKHGNRSSSGKCGSADFIEALGEQPMTVRGAEEALDKSGFGFLFAPAFHPAMAAVKAARKEIGVSTIFNLLGVLLNPAKPTHMVLGVAKRDLGFVYVKVLRRLGIKGLVVSAENGLDEISPCGGTWVWRIEEDEPSLLYPKDFGLDQEHALESVAGGMPAENAQRWRELAKDKALSDWVCMNAGAALVALGVCKTFAEGTLRARAGIPK